MKQMLPVLLLMFCCSTLKAQTTLDTYADFTEAFAQNKTDFALGLGNKILAATEKLPAKTQTNFYSKMAMLYENTDNVDQAITYWNKVILAEPDYFTAHRALGYLYLKQSTTLGKKLNASIGDKINYDKNLVAYKSCVADCLTHLEKSQACDPDDQTLNVIKGLYHSLKQDAKFNSLEDRLKPMRQNCVSLLTD